jgi:hypothetical protein
MIFQVLAKSVETNQMGESAGTLQDHGKLGRITSGPFGNSQSRSR